MEFLSTYPKLIELYELNTIDTKKKIINKINLLPSDTDCEGFVYGFTKPEDKNTRNSFFMKLGRTIRDPNIRIKEWSGEHVFSIKSTYNKKFERLVHLFFKFANVKRENKNNNDSEEIEWFKFEKKQNINKHYIIARVNEINSLLDDLYPEDEYPEDKCTKIECTKIEYTKDEHVKDEHVKDEHAKNEYAKNEYTKDEYAKDEYIKDEHAKDEYAKYLDNINLSNKDCIKSDIKFKINQCSKEDLMKINGIGKLLSEKIIKNRPFTTFNEIYKLHGIGDEKLNLIKKYCQL